MGSRERNIVLAIPRVVAAQCRESLQDSVSHRSITRKCVQDQIDKGVIGLIGVCEDESARIDPLSQTSPQLIQASIAIEIDLDYRT